MSASNIQRNLASSLCISMYVYMDKCMCRWSLKHYEGSCMNPLMFYSAHLTSWTSNYIARNSRSVDHRSHARATPRSDGFASSTNRTTCMQLITHNTKTRYRVGSAHHLSFRMLSYSLHHYIFYLNLSLISELSAIL